MSRSRYMKVPLSENWHQQRVASRPYPLGEKDRAFLDETFDNLHRQGRMDWVTEPTSFASPVFVVWRKVNGREKGRVVVDLRNLNSVTLPDAYPMPLQEEMIRELMGKRFISAVDARVFFHQFFS